MNEEQQNPHQTYQTPSLALAESMRLQQQKPPTAEELRKRVVLQQLEVQNLKNVASADFGGGTQISTDQLASDVQSSIRTLLHRRDEQIKKLRMLLEEERNRHQHEMVMLRNELTSSHRNELLQCANDSKLLLRQVSVQQNVINSLQAQYSALENQQRFNQAIRVPHSTQPRFTSTNRFVPTPQASSRPDDSIRNVATITALRNKVDALHILLASKKERIAELEESVRELEDGEESEDSLDGHPLISRVVVQDDSDKASEVQQLQQPQPQPQEQKQNLSKKQRKKLAKQQQQLMNEQAKLKKKQQQQQLLPQQVHTEDHKPANTPQRTDKTPATNTQQCLDPSMERFYNSVSKFTDQLDQQLDAMLKKHVDGDDDSREYHYNNESFGVITKDRLRELRQAKMHQLQQTSSRLAFNESTV